MRTKAREDVSDELPKWTSGEPLCTACGNTDSPFRPRYLERYRLWSPDAPIDAPPIVDNPAFLRWVCACGFEYSTDLFAPEVAA